MGERIEILGNGFVEHLETLGDDTFIAKFARGSFGKGEFKSHERNVSLVRYLIEHRHTSPIEAGQMAFKIKVPIFVARQLMRHRTFSFNELSLRYVQHSGDYYLPDVDRIRVQDTHNKQGSGEPLSQPVAQTYQDLIKDTTESCIKNYKLMTSNGVANETARMVLPTNMNTVICMTCDTKNLLNFLSLRDESHAQWEIQELARAVASFFERDFPALYSAYEDFVKYSATFSAKELEIIRAAFVYLKIETEQDLKNVVEFCNPEGSEIYGSERRYKDFCSKIFPESEVK